MDVETVKKMIKKNQAEYSLFLASCKVARNYYKNKTDILLQSKKADNDNNPLRNADNRIPLNFHGLLVNQKASYMYTSPPIFDLGSDNANKVLSRFLGDKYAKVCKDLCIEASNCSVGWIHLWNTKGNGLKYAVVPAEQIVPIFSKNLEKELIGVLRTYQDFSDDGEALTVYEYWDDKVCQSYHVRAGGSILPIF